MTLFVRVDDRLIHGQVVGGWLPVIQARRILVASDKAAGDPLQIGLMRMAVPDDVAVDVWTLDRAAAHLVAGKGAGGERVMLILPGVKELSQLVEGGAPITQVNLGGLHDAPGRSMVAPHLAFSAEERALLGRLHGQGIGFETRALPGDVSVPLSDLVAGFPKG